MLIIHKFTLLLHLFIIITVFRKDKNNTGI
jgi:hypothetical protein